MACGGVLTHFYAWGDSVLLPSMWCIHTCGEGVARSVLFTCSVDDFLICGCAGEESGGFFIAGEDFMACGRILTHFYAWGDSIIINPNYAVYTYLCWRDQHKGPLHML